MSTTYEIVMEDRRKLVNRIIENLKNEKALYIKGWSSEMLRPQNPISQAKYLGGNRIKLMCEAIDKEYKDPRWITFIQAKEAGYHIKKGAHGVHCEKWIFSKKVKEIDSNGKTIIKEEKLEKPKVSYFTVFNAEEIEGIPRYKTMNLEKGEMLKVANRFIESSECKIKEVAQDKAYYSPSSDEIVLPLREAFKSEEAFLRTTLHEMGHSTGHKERLGRDLVTTFGTPEYAKEELVAELTSLFTQAELNIKLEGQHFNDHTGYIKSWIEVLENSPNELFRAAAQAEKATTRLMENYHELEQNRNSWLEKIESEKVIGLER